MPRQILDFASLLLPSIAPGLAPARSLRADAGALRVTRVPAADLGARVAAECATALGRPGSVAVICADAHLDENARELRAAGLRFAVLGSDETSTDEHERGRHERGATPTPGG